MKTIGVRITYAWWFKVYLDFLFLFCFLFRREPNEERMMYWMAKAVRFKAELVDIDESRPAEQPPSDNLH